MNQNSINNNEESLIHVSAGVIRNKDRILICQRPEGKSCALLWEFPGGKQEPNESMEQCLQRELSEELDIVVQNIQPLTKITRKDAGLCIHFFTCDLDGKQPVKKEHHQILWVKPEELDGYSFCPSDAAMLAQIPENKLIV